MDQLVIDNLLSQVLPSPMERVEKSRRYRNSPVKYTIPTLLFNDKPLAFPDEVVAIAGRPGCGKTGISQGIIALALSAGAGGMDDITIAENINSYAVIRFDNEQSDRQQITAIDKNLRRCGIEGNGPDHYYNHTLLDESVDPAKMMDEIEEICKAVNEISGGIHLVVIDGGAHCTDDTNDNKGSQQTVTRMCSIARQYHCVVIVIVHTNYGNDKPRGGFGSELIRYSAAALLIKTDGNGVSEFSPIKVRHTGEHDFPCVKFRYDRDMEYHVTCGIAEALTKTEKLNLKHEQENEEIIKNVFPAGTTLTREEAISEIMDDRGCKKEWATKYFSRIKKSGKIQKTGERYNICTAIL